MHCSITSDDGQLTIGDFQLFWGNPFYSDFSEYGGDFGGYFGISYGPRSIEIGDIDQGMRGIHYTVYSSEITIEKDGKTANVWDLVTSKTLVRFR